MKDEFFEEFEAELKSVQVYDIKRLYNFLKLVIALFSLQICDISQFFILLVWNERGAHLT